MRILLLFIFTAFSFIANQYLHEIPTVIWYFIFTNSFAFILVFVNFLLLKKERKALKNQMLYYFCGIGGIFGGFFMMILSGFYKLEKRFIFYQALILFFWCVSLIMLFKHYAPFKEIITNLI